MYVVPEELREDVSNYNKAQYEAKWKDGKVLYRYARQKTHRHWAMFIKISMVMMIGFSMIALLCFMSTQNAATHLVKPGPAQPYIYTPATYSTPQSAYLPGSYHVNQYPYAQAETALAPVKPTASANDQHQSPVSQNRFGKPRTNL